MAPWLITLVVGLGGPALVASGAWIGAVVSGRSQRRTTEVASRAAISKAENELVDQLQEELARYRDTADRRATVQDERMNRLERYSDGYRSHAHELRAHIWDGKGPPPPDWPADLPK